MELPGGGLDFGEDIYKELKREIKEEMGVRIKSIERRPVCVWPWLYERRRNMDMDWYYSFVVAYRMELESCDLKVILKNVRRMDFSQRKS